MKPSRPLSSAAGIVRDSLARIRRAVKDGVPGPSLAALATAAGVSGRTLQRHFLDLLGKPPRDVIADARLQRALLLIQTTTMPLADVAVAVGLGSQSRMNELFRRGLGRSPGAFREGGLERPKNSGKPPLRRRNVKSSCVSRGRKTAGDTARQ